MKNIFISPLLCIAVSAAFGFYFLSSAHAAFTITVLLIALFIFSFLRVLSSDIVQEKFIIIEFNSKQSSRKLLQITTLCAAFCFIGLFFGICAADAGKNAISFGIPENKITAVEGILLEDPRVLGNGNVLVSLSLKRSFSNPKTGEKIQVSSSGEITLFFSQESTQKLREFGRGVRIFAEGNLKTNDRGYTFNASSLHITKPASAIEKMRTSIRLNLINRFDKKAWGGLALALLVGIRDNLDSSFTSVYRDAGLSYILALSGMHLAIIAAIIAFLLKKPFGLKAASIIGAVIISLYCLFVGPMPSLIRSAIMYLLGVMTVLFALPKKSLSILCLSFLIQIIITPSCGNSLSFILSYLALLGILITSRHVSALLNGIIPDFILNPLSLSIGAFLATAGVCGYFFGIISPIGIIAGLLIVPLTTVFMIGGIIYLVLDLFSISAFLGYPLFWLYRLMEIISSIAGKVPGIKINYIIVLVSSIIILILIAVFDYKYRKSLVNLKPFPL
ncbi:MAG: ComEC/Rec2 family competence protein [Treponema sp.]|nr:ComEC/Rec2 family competence protein [Treponema sp.]